MKTIVRRAKQFKELGIRVPHVPPKRLAFTALSDASFQNGPGGSTQAGSLITTSDKKIGENQDVEWGPVTWRSHKLRKIAGRTLAAA